MTRRKNAAMPHNARAVLDGEVKLRKGEYNSRDASSDHDERKVMTITIVPPESRVGPSLKQVRVART